MAEVPEGAVLNDAGDIRFPTVQFENVYVLPGIPQLFESKLLALKDAILRADPYFMRAIYTNSARELVGRASECDAGDISTVDAGVVSQVWSSGISGEADAGIEGPGLSGKRVSSSAGADSRGTQW